MDNWSLAIVAALVLGYAALSRRLERTVVTAPMVFVGAGLVVGTEVLGWLDPRIGSSGVRALAEATLTLVLFIDASRIDRVRCAARSRCRRICSESGCP